MTDRATKALLRADEALSAATVAQAQADYVGFLCAKVTVALGAAVAALVRDDKDAALANLGDALEQQRELNDHVMPHQGALK